MSQLLTLSMKSKLLVLPHQSTNVCIPTYVRYYKCASKHVTVSEI